MQFYLAVAIVVSVFIAGYVSYLQRQHRPNYVLHEVEKVAVSDFYRKIIGYDSLEMIYSLNKWNVNFCYPNEWGFEKFKNKKVKSITFKYDSIIILNFDSSEVK